MEEKTTHHHAHGHDGCHDHACGCCHEEEEMRPWRPIMSAVMLAVGFVIGHYGWPLGWWSELLWYLVAFLPVGLPVMHEALEGVEHERDFFSEFMLMSIASVGAFAIGEYPEGVAVMLLYCIGEMLQDKAVERARRNITSMMALRPDHALVVEGTEITMKSPETVAVGDTIEVRPGDRVPLDGVLLTADAAFDTAALTGESVPRTIETGGEVLAGMIAAGAVVRLRVVRPAADSAVSRILTLVEEASERKAPTELFIHRFAHVYTPVVFALAALLVVVPALYSLVDTTFAFVLGEWLYRSLMLLVISCPCALVISVPLSYFAGIGAASKRGILFKGSNYLDAVSQLRTVVFDKTGTLTTGRFSVTRVEGLSVDEFAHVAAIEATSTHPIARAICELGVRNEELGVRSEKLGIKSGRCLEVQNVAGLGLMSEGWLVGTLRLLEREDVSYPAELAEIPETIVAVAREGAYRGYILLSDTPKSDAREAVAALRRQGVGRVEILSGDKQALVDKVAAELNIDKASGDLLPEGKIKRIEELKAYGGVAFVGDGINDAPVLALSDVGFAMGGMGADMAVETADVVIQTDQPSKIAESIAISQRTRRIVHQNIALAIGVKLLVLVLGFLGVANLWEAVFADSGVALLAVLNATRVFWTKGRSSFA